MPLFLTSEEIAFQNKIREFAKKIVQPRAKKIDQNGEFPYDILEEFKKIDIFKINIPKKYGGLELGFVYLCIIMEEISKFCASSSLILQVQETASQVIKIAGSEEQKERFLPKIGTGDIMLAFALTEPKSGSDAQSIRSSAKKVDGGYILNGTKCFVSNGNVADYFVTFAKIKEEGNEKITCFLVPKKSKGLRMGVIRDKMGLRGSITTEFFMKDVFVDESLRIGKEGMGFLIALSTLDRTRPMIGAQAVGIAGGAFDYALKYSQKRIQFGKPILHHEGVGFMLADMITKIEAARLLVYKAARLIDKETKEGKLRFSKKATMYSAMSKMFASETATEVTSSAVQILGGYGYMRDFILERYMRDAKVTQIYEGTNQIQRYVIMNIMKDLKNHLLEE
ncbi:MAG: acyl-CoA dehydrogenase family protein [Proteobacteria bacterium]|nr:acyl-CoA dehydrogenase family protein [Pseudomonadota bacterium]